MDDRLNLSDTFELTDAERAVLQDRGIDASDIAEFRFFTNQFETETQGVDLVAHTAIDWRAGTTYFELGFSYSDTLVTRYDPNLVDARGLRSIEDGVPGKRWNLTGTHTHETWRFLFRLNYYGRYYDGDARGGIDDAYVYDLSLIHI